MSATIVQSTLEREVIVLKAVWNLIDDLVNYVMFVNPTGTVDVAMMPESSTHQRLFNILLVDFLSKPPNGQFGLAAPPQNGRLVDQTYLFFLSKICETPCLNPPGADLLRLPVEKFANWLEENFVIEDVWLPSVQIELDMRLKRIEPIRICGNIAKHNFSRLDRDVRAIRLLIERNGHQVDDGQSYIIIPEFYEWFHDNVLNYQISHIAEMLNDIRWGIYDYLKPHFDKSIVREPPPSIYYEYSVPAECGSALSRAMYWDLMNDVRAKPYMPRFTVDSHLKNHF